MRKLFVWLALPIILSSCSLTGAPSKYAQLTNVKSLAEYLIPKNREVVRLSAQILNISQDEKANAVFRTILLARNAETRELQRAYRAETGTEYLLAAVSPMPIVSLDGLMGNDAVKTYVDAIIKEHEDSIAAAKYVEKTASGATLSTLSDSIITGRQQEVGQLKALVPQK